MKNYIQTMPKKWKAGMCWLLVVLAAVLFYCYVPIMNAPIPTAFAGEEGNELFDAEVKVSVKEYFKLKEDFEVIFSPEAI